MGDRKVSKPPRLEQESLFMFARLFDRLSLVKEPKTKKTRFCGGGKKEAYVFNGLSV